MNIWVKENWFKLALVLVIPITALVFIYGFVIYPENIRREEKAAEQIRAEFEATQVKAKEEERVENLKLCLAESESQETYEHLAYCGENNRSPKLCSEVFAGAENTYDVLRNLKSHDSEKRLTFDDAFEQCNCSLEGWIRDGFEEDKKERDQLCYSLYSS
jgi:hypothetical protein